ncbi:hypothetical protein TSOC_005252 [Tetrabaena socialis]|uniref:Pherophorin domain-containing protein n=1 Tax=Tetrabaena socialis TaxID=47790 RepID=A0A2J8A6Y9_9CHLO|nr:hypothetical protein TSOC_005252 [Tetrabaena socialis]|eukprot:PNH08253.1 hypothetical protein TSOC_005252 [Tetrabaena socialis]
MNARDYRGGVGHSVVDGGSSNSTPQPLSSFPSPPSGGGSGADCGCTQSSYSLVWGADVVLGSSGAVAASGRAGLRRCRLVACSMQVAGQNTVRRCAPSSCSASTTPPSRQFYAFRLQPRGGAAAAAASSATNAGAFASASVSSSSSSSSASASASASASSSSSASASASASSSSGPAAATASASASGPWLLPRLRFLTFQIDPLRATSCYAVAEGSVVRPGSLGQAFGAGVWFLPDGPGAGEGADPAGLPVLATIGVSAYGTDLELTLDMGDLPDRLAALQQSSPPPRLAPPPPRPPRPPPPDVPPDVPHVDPAAEPPGDAQPPPDGAEPPADPAASTGDLPRRLIATAEAEVVAEEEATVRRSMASAAAAAAATTDDAPGAALMRGTFLVGRCGRVALQRLCRTRAPDGSGTCLVAFVMEAPPPPLQPPQPPGASAPAPLLPPGAPPPAAPPVLPNAPPPRQPPSLPFPAPSNPSPVPPSPGPQPPSFPPPSPGPQPPTYHTFRLYPKACNETVFVGARNVCGSIRAVVNKIAFRFAVSTASCFNQTDPLETLDKANNYRRVTVVRWRGVRFWNDTSPARPDTWLPARVGTTYSGRSIELYIYGLKYAYTDGFFMLLRCAAAPTFGEMCKRSQAGMCLFAFVDTPGHEYVSICRTQGVT